MANKKLTVFSLLPFFILLLFMPDLSTLACLTGAVIHEAGHIIAILVCHHSCKIFSRTGGLEIRVDDYGSIWERILISTSGCLANLITAAIIYALRSTGVFLNLLFYSSLFLSCFNLIPARGLDGGELLEGILNSLFLPHISYIIFKIISLVFSLFLWVAAVYILFINPDNLSMFAVCAVLLFQNLKD